MKATWGQYAALMHTVVVDDQVDTRFSTLCVVVQQSGS